MLETIVNFVDFWVWSLAPTILLLGLLLAFPPPYSSAQLSRESQTVRRKRAQIR